MADDSSGGGMADQIKAAMAAQQAVELAIQKALASFTATAEVEINKLIQANTLGPDVSADMLKMQQAAIDMTIKAIQDGPLGAYTKKGN
ncbi:MAG: hypothetical protein EP335_11675 [Alphaproteobacteria bacterium]|nr:MAG: hypothetical protein EP335_11675 [Alphaproteobacteria bacterium]